MKISYADLERWDVCDRDTRYTRAAFLALTGGRESITPEDVFDLNIPREDKLWLLLRPEIIPEPALHLLACEFAEHVLPADCDPRSRAAIEVKRRWVNGQASDYELICAFTAAWNAVQAIAFSAARDAARAAFFAADHHPRAAFFVAMDATNAVHATDELAEQRWQLDRVRAVMDGQSAS